MDGFSLFALIFIGFVSLIYLFFKRKYSYWRNRGVAYVEPRIPVGNLPRRGAEHLKDIVSNIYKVKNEKPFAGAYFLTRPVAVATDLDFVQDVLIRDFHNFHERGMFSNEEEEPLTAHLFSLDGPRWKSLRMKFTPTFTSGKMKLMFPTIIEVANRFDEALSDLLQDKSIYDVKELLAQFTTDVIGTCAFGIECNSLKDPDNVFRKYGRQTLQPRIGVIGRALFLQLPSVAKFLGLKIMQKEISDFFIGIVRDTVEYREKNNIKRNDFMDLLIELKNNETKGENDVKLEKLTIEQVAAQAFLFFIAGFETSSTTMTYSLYELAMNPSIQERARAEIHTVLSKYNGELTYEAVKDMVYIDQIISEALRKYAPVVILSRKAHKDYKVRNSNLTIEKGVSVMIPAYCIHHDPDYYPDPEKFDPNRFTPEEIKKRHPMAFLGFGDGPRNCIGLRFGRMQSRIGLITLLKNYRFKISHKTPIPIEFSKTSFILSPVDGMHLKIEKI